VKLVVCALHDVADMARRHSPHGVVSLLSPGQPVPDFAKNARHLILRFHDIAEPREGLTAPDIEAVGRLLAFGGQGRAGDTLLVHCWMGISRSPAAAFVLACAAAPRASEMEVARALRRTAPAATPNPALVRLADGLLARDGRMVAAASSIGRGCESGAGAPFELDTTLLAISSGGAP
jgi:predicted protein tyrosine phosphatase